MSDFDKRNGSSSSANDNRRIFIPPPSSGPSTTQRAPQRGRPGPPMTPRRDGPPGRPRPAFPGGAPGGPGGPGGPDEPRVPIRRGPPRPWYKRLKWKRVLAISSILLVVLLVGTYLYVNTIFNRIERVEVSEVLAHGGDGTNYLIVGSDSAEVLDADNPVFDPDRPGGQRSDTMMLLRFTGGKAKIVSLPRDLWVTRADNGEPGKLNGAYNGGPSSLVKTISDNLGIPIHRYLEVDFVSFAGLVDGLGGVTINFPHPATDENTGLNITETGPVKLNGEQALQYVRSRNYTELIDGKPKKDPTADLGRIQRQQAFLRAVFAKLGKSSNPFTLLRTASGVTDGLRIDDEMTLMGALRFAWNLRGLEPEPLALTTHGERKGGAAVLILEEDASAAVLDQFR